MDEVADGVLVADTVTGYLYVPARWRAPSVANFRDVAMLAYDAS